MVHDQQSPTPDQDNDDDGKSNTRNVSESSSPPTFTIRGDFVDILATKVTKALLRNTMKNAEEPINKLLDDHLPKDPTDIRKLPFYDSTVDAIKFQRDLYLIGPKYANRRRREQRLEDNDGYKSEHEMKHNRQRFQPALPPFRPFRGGGGVPVKIMTTTMPFDATASGHIQLVNIGQSFIPSQTIKNLLLPIVLDLPTGALRVPITNAVANSLPLAQPALDRAVKSAILNFMGNPNARQVIKNRTQGVLRVDIDANVDKRQSKDTED